MNDNKKSQKMPWLMLILIGLIIASIALAWVRPWQSKDEIPASTPIKVGYLPIYVDLPLFVAFNHGLFAQNNISVEMVKFENSPDMKDALLTGRIDAAASVATATVLAAEQRASGKMKVFLVDAENSDAPLSSLVIPEGSGIKSVQDLKGKRIGFFPGPAAKTFGVLALEKLGLLKSDYEMIEMPVAQHLEALTSKTVDALVTYEPTATQAVIENKGTKLVPGLIENNVISPWQAGVWVVSSDLLERRLEATSRFINSIYQAVDIISTDSKTAKKSLTNYTPISETVALSAPNIPFTKIGNIDLEALQKHADILKERGAIDKKIQVEPLIIDKKLIYK